MLPCMKLMQSQCVLALCTGLLRLPSKRPCLSLTIVMHVLPWKSRPQVLNDMTQSHSPRATLVLQGACPELNLYSLAVWGG